MNLKSAFPTFFTIIAKFNKPQISEQEQSAINAARQSLTIYYANLHKDRDKALARRQWLRLNNHQAELHALLDESVNPEALYTLGVELQRAKGTIRSDYDF
jgi:predicted O-linked N-acetylglucosamine transferase (SPINDLY family)